MIFSLFIMGSGLYLLLQDYESFTRHLLESYGRADKLELLRTYLPPLKFLIVSAFLFIIGALGAVFSYIYRYQLSLVDKRIKTIIRFFYHHVLWCAAFVKGLPKRERIALAFIMAYIIICRTYLAIKWPLILDETFSYLFFVKKGFLVTLAYYPGPNNHILYNFLCLPLEWLFSDPVWIMRLPGLLAGIFVPLLFFIWLRHRFDSWLAFLALTFVIIPYNLTVYSFLGRGYMLQLLLILNAAYFFFKYLKTANEYYRVLFIVSSVLGFLTIPTFLYPWLTMAIMAFFIYREFTVTSFQLLFKTGLLIVGLTLLAYFPVIIISGPTLLFANSWVVPHDFDGFIYDWFYYLDEYFNNLWNADANGWLMTLGCIGLAYSLKQYEFFMERVPAWNSWIKAWLVVILTPLVFILLQRVLPFQRVWLYVVLLNSVMVIFVFYVWLRRLGFTEWQSFAVWVFIGFLVDVSYWNDTLKKGFGVYDYVDKFTTELVESNPKNVLVTEDVYYVFTRYESEQHHTPFKVETSVHNGPYDWVVLPAGNDWPKGIDETKYNWTYNDPFVRAYQLKKESLK